MNDDLISRSALKEKLKERYYNDGLDIVTAIELIDNAPTVEPCRNCDDKQQAEYIRQSSSWYELQSLRKFKEEHERLQGEWEEVKHRLNLLIGVLYSNYLISESELEYIEDSIKKLMKGGAE